MGSSAVKHQPSIHPPTRSFLLEIIKSQFENSSPNCETITLVECLLDICSTQKVTVSPKNGPKTTDLCEKVYTYWRLLTTKPLVQQSKWVLLWISPFKGIKGKSDPENGKNADYLSKLRLRSRGLMYFTYTNILVGLKKVITFLI